MVDPQVSRMHTAKKILRGCGGTEGKTNELITVTKTTTEENNPTARFMIRSRAEVSPNRGLLSRPLVPYVLVVKSSMAAFHTHAYTARPPGSQQHRLLETPAQCRMLSRKLAAVGKVKCRNGN